MRSFIVLILLFTLNANGNEVKTQLVDTKQKKQQPLYLLTAEEKQVLESGEIGTTRYVISGISSIYLGLGIGQAIQSRFKKTGWYFLTADLISGIVILGEAFGNGFGSMICSVAGGSNCESNAEKSNKAKIASAIFVTSRVLGIIDAWYGGYQHNKEVRHLKQKVKSSNPAKGSAYIWPNSDGIQLGYIYSF